MRTKRQNLLIHCVVWALLLALRLFSGRSLVVKRINHTGGYRVSVTLNKLSTDDIPLLDIIHWTSRP